MSVGDELDAPIVPADPDLLARWIGVAGLLASAEELQTRRGGAWPGLALITADTADEAVLGLIAASGTPPPSERDTFDRIYELALAVLDERGHTMPQGLRTRLLQVHRQRNLAVHLGVEPAPRMVQTALRTATELRSLAIDSLEILEAFRTAGPVRAVAHVIAIPVISQALSEAERLLGEDQLVEAADQAAIALHEALERVSPSLRTRPRGFRIPHIDREVRDALSGLRDRANRHEAWILATGLGLRPRELRRLQRTVGEPIYTMAGPQPHSIPRDPRVELNRPLVEWAVLTTADIIYRLWQDDSLFLSDDPWREELEDE